MADTRLLMQILNQMDPGRLGQLISEVQQPERFVGGGMFDAKPMGMRGGLLTQGPVQQYGAGPPAVRR